MKKILILSMALMAVSAAPAMAQDSGFEGHVGVSIYDTNEFIGAQARLGYMHDIGNLMIGVEGEAGTAFSDTSETVFDPVIGNVDVDLGLDSNIGIYGVARTNRRSNFGLIGRLGYHSTTFGADLANEAIGVISADLKTDGFAGGIGVDYAFGNDRKNVIRLDATYLDLGDLDIDDGLTVLALSYGHRF